jgi:hypothetical protein
MKDIKLYALLLPVFLASGSCTRWLDGAQPIDQNLDEIQFSSEVGVNSVLNGLYRTLSSTTLYGGTMTMTTMELLAHYYYYEEELLNNGDFTYFNYVSNYKYDDSDVKKTFSNVWGASYSAIFEINNFIKKVSDSEILPEAKKNTVLGEAYGLRAFLHLDLFRLFGSKTQGIPYNTSAEVIPHGELPHDSFFTLLLLDVERAKALLKDDPILTDGVKDLTQVEAADNVTEKEIFDKYLRNYRMNYYAVLALQARALMHKGDVQEAAQVAQSLIDAAFGDKKPFRWADKAEMVSKRDYIFYSEVVFGVYNFNLYTTWEDYTNGSRAGHTYTVHVNNLRENIFRFDNTGGDVSLWEDVRIQQWTPSRVGQGQYVSYKFANFSRVNGNDPRYYFQPLIRTSEMFLIVAENLLQSGQTAEAVRWLNELRFRRGSQQASLPDPDATTQSEAFDMLEAEHYKEFYAEGQAFFYLKRRQSSRIFDPNRVGRVDVTSDIYLIPIPESETNL